MPLKRWSRDWCRENEYYAGFARVFFVGDIECRIFRKVSLTLGRTVVVALKIFDEEK